MSAVLLIADLAQMALPEVNSMQKKLEHANMCFAGKMLTDRLGNFRLLL